jgi:hypothetical protein
MGHGLDGWNGLARMKRNGKKLYDAVQHVQGVQDVQYNHMDRGEHVDFWTISDDFWTVIGRFDQE